MCVCACASVRARARVCARARNSHKDSVRIATVEEHLYGKTIHPATKAQLHLPPLDLSWAHTYSKYK